MSATDLTPLLRSLGEDASILEAVPVGSIDDLDDLITRREFEDHPCTLGCDQPAEYAYVLHHDTLGARWLDLCRGHATATGKANDAGVFDPAREA